MRPAEQNSRLRSYCQKVFTGDIRHPWIDRQTEHLFPQCRVIKEIRANLFLKWIHTAFPEIPLLFIVRHPCAVALSRMQLGWWTDRDIGPLLSQPKLIDDFLVDKLDIVWRAQTVEAKHAVIWCISNLVPIKQFQANGLTVIFYENLCTRPEDEVPKIFRAMSHDFNGSIFEFLNKPSTTSRHTSAIVTGANKVTRWKSKLSTKQIDNVLSVVRDFGLDYIYGDSFTPLVATL